MQLLFMNMLCVCSLLNAMEKVEPVRLTTVIAETKKSEIRRLIVKNEFESYIVITCRLEQAPNDEVKCTINPSSEGTIVITSPITSCTVHFLTRFYREKFGIKPVEYADAFKKLNELHSKSDIHMRVKKNSYATSGYAAPLAWLLAAEVAFKFPKAIADGLIPVRGVEWKGIWDVFPNAKEKTYLFSLLNLPKETEFLHVLTAKRRFIQKWQPVIESENAEDAVFAQAIINQIEHSYRIFFEELKSENR
jgi:hypothetical protein